MAAGPKPPELLGSVRFEAQRAVGTVPGLEFWSDTRGAAQHDGHPTDLVVQPTQSRAEPVLQSALAEFVLLTAFVEHVATKRLWRDQQRRQHATIQQSRLLQPWRWRREPFVRRTQAVTFKH